MTPVEPDKHPATPVGAAHLFNKVTGSFAARPHGHNRCLVDVSVDMLNVLSDAYQMWVDAGDDTDEGGAA